MGEIRNAKIISTHLGYNEIGILTFSLTLEIAGGGVGCYGNCVLDTYDRITDRRVPVAHSMECITAILKIVGVDIWENLAGRYIRIEDNGWGGRIDKIGNLMEDTWMSLRALFGREEESETE